MGEFTGRVESQMELGGWDPRVAVSFSRNRQATLINAIGWPCRETDCWADLSLQKPTWEGILIVASSDTKRDGPPPLQTTERVSNPSLAAF